MNDIDFSKSPFLVIWETTHACDLACLHCRAHAEPEPAPNELTDEEGLKLIKDVKDMGAPILIFSGGDPLKRNNLDGMVSYAHHLGLRTGAIPAVTDLLTKERVQDLKKAGLDQIAFSLDAAGAKEHDEFRRKEGVFVRTLEAVKWAKQVEIPVQINSFINVHNTENLDELVDLIENLGIVFWEVFFLVPTGRGKDLELLKTENFDAVFEKIYSLSKRAKFIIKVTEAPQYRAFYCEKERQVNGFDDSVQMPEYLRRKSGPGGSMGRAPMGVNAGKGFLFVSCTGEVYPSGFLPLSAGNVRDRGLAEIYRESSMLNELRDPSRLKGKCGPCKYKDLCGGSRSRAFAVTGDYMAEDPCCSYNPV